MEATYRALCAHGYANLTMQGIADEFEKSKSLIHYHYDTKEELFVAFLEYLLDRYTEGVEVSETDAPLDRLEEFLDVFVVAPDDEDAASLVVDVVEFRSQAAHNEAYREQLASNYEAILDVFAGIIEDGIKAGVFREVDPRRTAELLFAALDGARNRQVTLDAPEATTTMRETLMEQVVEPLLLEEGR